MKITTVFVCFALLLFLDFKPCFVQKANGVFVVRRRWHGYSSGNLHGYSSGNRHYYSSGNRHGYYSSGNRLYRQWWKNILHFGCFFELFECEIEEMTPVCAYLWLTMPSTRQTRRRRFYRPRQTSVFRPTRSPVMPTTTTPPTTTAIGECLNILGASCLVVNCPPSQIIPNKHCATGLPCCLP